MPTGQSTKKSNKETIDEISELENLADQSLEPTPITQWGKKSEAADEGLILELPSGNVCKIRRTMDMMMLLQAGKIPNPLAGVVNKMIDTGDTNFGKFAQEAEDPEVIRQLFELLNQTMARSFLEPPVSAPPPRLKKEPWSDYITRIELPEQEDGESDKEFEKRYHKEGWHKKGTLNVNDIDMEDKMYVFAVAQGAAADLTRFRDEQESVVGALQAGERVVKPTKRTGGSKSKK